MSPSENAELALKLVRSAPLICFDTEGTGLDWKRNSVVGYVITADEENNCYVPIRHGGGGNLGGAKPIEAADAPHEIHPWEVELSAAFRERTTKGLLTVGHFIKFDCHFAANHGVMLGRHLEDTWVNEALLTARANGFSLDACCKRWRVTEKKGEELYVRLAEAFGGETGRDQMANYWRTSGDDPVATEYAKGDGVSTLALRAAQIVHINKPYDGEWSLANVHKMESDLIWTVFRMERRGIKIDVEQLQRVKNKLAGMENEANRQLPDGFNAKSTAQVEKWLRDKGVVDFPRTDPSSKFPDGQVSIRQKWLEAIPEGKPIVSLRKVKDLSSKFLTPLEGRHLFKGRVHASLHQLGADEAGTISGRFSCTDPNLQALTARDKVLGRLLRSVFVADEGMEFWESDLSQIEPRIVTHFTKNKTLIDGYNATPFIDIHTTVSKMTGLVRDLSKRVGMGLITGLSLNGFARHMEWDMDKAKPVYDNYHANFPELRRFYRDAMNVFEQRGYVRTMLGRVFWLEDPQYAYRALSRIVQGNCADFMKYNLLRADLLCESEGDKVQLMMTVHDSIVGQSRPEHWGKVQQVIHLFEEGQQPPFNFIVPTVMETGRGRSWGEAKYGPEK